MFLHLRDYLGDVELGLGVGSLVGGCSGVLGGPGTLVVVNVVNVTLVFVSSFNKGARGAMGGGRDFSTRRCGTSLRGSVAGLMGNVANDHGIAIIVALRDKVDCGCTRAKRGIDRRGDSRGGARRGGRAGRRCVAIGGTSNDRATVLLSGRVPRVQNITVIYRNNSGTTLGRGVRGTMASTLGVASGQMCVTKKGWGRGKRDFQRKAGDY